MRLSVLRLLWGGGNGQATDFKCADPASSRVADAQHPSQNGLCERDAGRVPQHVSVGQGGAGGTRGGGAGGLRPGGEYLFERVGRRSDLFVIVVVI